MVEWASSLPVARALQWPTAVAMVPSPCTSLPSHRSVPVYSVMGRTKLTLIPAWCRRHLRAGCCGSRKGVPLALVRQLEGRSSSTVG